MSISFEKVADRIFSIVKGSGRTVTMFDTQGQQVYDPLKARRFFTEPEATMITILEAGENSAIQLYLSEGTAIDDVERMLESLRHTATHYNLMWKVRKFSRRLSPKDFAYQADIEKEIANEGVEMTQRVAEGLSGSTRSSYQQVGDARIIIRHSAPVDEKVIGSRGRNIREIFVENGDGERLRMPANFLPGARALARHLSSGGEYHDATGETILGMVREWRNLRGVAGYIKENGRVITNMSEARLYGSFASNRMAEITETLRKLSGARGYPKTVETLSEATVEIDEAKVDGEVKTIIRILGVDEGNEPFMEGIKSLARQTLRHRGLVREDGEGEEDGFEVEGEINPEDEVDLDADVDLDDDADALSDEGEDGEEDDEDPEVDEEREPDDLKSVLADLMGDPAKLDFDPEDLDFDSPDGEPPAAYGSPTEEIVVKLGALAGAVTNRPLSIYLTAIRDKLADDRNPTAAEKKHMARALAVASRADDRLRIESSTKDVSEAARPAVRAVDADLFASLAAWAEGFTPERVLSESYSPSEFDTPKLDGKDQFLTGDAVLVIPTPELNRKALPEANWIEEKTRVTLKNPVTKGTLEGADVELQDGSTQKIYGFNIMDEINDDEEQAGGFEDITVKAGLNEDAVWRAAASLVHHRGDPVRLRRTASTLAEGDLARVMAKLDALWLPPVVDQVRRGLDETTEIVDDAEIAGDVEQISDMLVSSDTNIIEISDAGDILAAERLLQKAGLAFDTDFDTGRLTFDTEKDMERATDLLDREDIPHDVLGEEDGLDEPGLDPADDPVDREIEPEIDAEGEFDPDSDLETLDEDLGPTYHSLGGHKGADLLADVSPHARMDMTGITPGVHSEEFSLFVTGDAQARRAMRVLDEAGIDYSAYAPGRFEFGTEEDLEAATESLEAAGLSVTGNPADPVSFMAEMRRRLAGLY